MVAVTRVLLLDVSMLRECGGEGNADVGDRGGVVSVSVCDTSGSGIVSNAAYVL